MYHIIEKYLRYIRGYFQYHFIEYAIKNGIGGADEELFPVLLMAGIFEKIMVKPVKRLTTNIETYKKTIEVANSANTSINVTDLSFELRTNLQTFLELFANVYLNGAPILNDLKWDWENLHFIETRSQ